MSDPNIDEKIITGQFESEGGGEGQVTNPGGAPLGGMQEAQRSPGTGKSRVAEPPPKGATSEVKYTSEVKHDKIKTTEGKKSAWLSTRSRVALAIIAALALGIGSTGAYATYKLRRAVRVAAATTAAQPIEPAYTKSIAYGENVIVVTRGSYVIRVNGVDSLLTAGHERRTARQTTIISVADGTVIDRISETGFCYPWTR